MNNQRVDSVRVRTMGIWCTHSIVLATHSANCDQNVQIYASDSRSENHKREARLMTRDIRKAIASRMQ
eukprot:5559409-Amphidinium_carterae.1